jgi:hypothetical protein
LHDIENIVIENTDLCPGWVSSQYGYFVFASNEYGDAFCFNINQLDKKDSPQIVFISHEVIWDESTEEEVHASAVFVADNLLSFLNMFHEGEIQKEYE